MQSQYMMQYRFQYYTSYSSHWNLLIHQYKLQALWRGGFKNVHCLIELKCISFSLQLVVTCFRFSYYIVCLFVCYLLGPWQPYCLVKKWPGLLPTKLGLKCVLYLVTTTFKAREAMLRDNLAVAWIFRKKNDFEIFFANLSEGPFNNRDAACCC